ncbi:MAG TPA: phospholipase D-like domain-containing protein, partial [Oculatellaceae cyanobacterium]
MYSLWPAPGLPPANRTGCHSNVGVYRDPVVAGDSNGSFHLLMKGDILVNILYSNFSGSSWSSLQDLGSGSDPIIYVDQNNTVHAAWLTTTAPVYKTKEAGASWSSTENIFDNAFCIDLSLTVDRDNSPRLTCRNNGFIYETSRQAGAWTEATIITGNEGNAGQPTIASDVLGNLHMVWSDLRTGNWEIFYTIDPAYDCSDIVLSPIAQAIQAEVDQKEYCGNHYDDGLITLPPGEEAFDQFFNLVLEAKYEIDFTTMIWDAYRPDRSELGDSPGIILLKGLQELAVKIQNNPLNYPPEGVHVRILLGLKEGAYREPSDEPHHEDQRLRVLDDLETLSLLDDPKLNIEVALYRDGEIKANHSHAKMMIIDGREVIVTGYNMQYSYLNGSNRRDMGLQVSGPIAAHSLQVFDKLWAGARQCVEYDANHCIQEATVGLISHNPAIISTGNDIVFSLYRDGDRTLGNGDKTADRAIIAAIKAASTNVHIMQDRFMNPYVEHQPYNIVLAEYARAILDALEKEGS